MSNLLYDRKHPIRSPLLGKFLSATLCLLGHRVVVKSWDRWERDWVACAVCGARFIPADALSDTSTKSDDLDGAENGKASDGSDTNS